ncbi:MAG: hypothetical protein M1522_04760 [Actinobacteria bacterium]|jgi:hypothetical protein|nr:hypothetical protein [Actinomycetota bacterium]
MRNIEEIESDIETTRGIFEAARDRLVALSLEHSSAVAKATWPEGAELLYEAEYDSSESSHFPIPTGVIMADGTYVDIDPAAETAELLRDDLEALCELDSGTYLSATSIVLV